MIARPDVKKMFKQTDMCVQICHNQSSYGEVTRILNYTLKWSRVIIILVDIKYPLTY